ncbi:MAG: hypothetical protein DMG02_00610, partial [Acidobacteria bacterium]
KIVGLAVPRSLDMVVALLGITKTGAAYLPLDLESPISRLTLMLRNVSALGVVAGGDALKTLSVTDAVSVIIGVPLVGEGEISNPLVFDRCSVIREQNLAYVIYTSGSTGKPKAVGVSHRALTNYLAWGSRLYASTDGAGAPLNTPLAFDATVTSVYLPLLWGQRVTIVPEANQLERLAELLKHGPDFTLVKLTPSHLLGLAGLLGQSAADVRPRRLVIGGETLTTETARFWRSHAPMTKLVNEYGPTEATVGCCIHEIHDASLSGTIPIGHPTPGTRLYVLDERLSTVPAGVLGELYIAGDQVARGYVNNSQQTGARFVPDIAGPPGARMYRTGDLARWMSDGQLEYVGRDDHQVKIRGHRVELGEVEAALVAEPAIAEAVAVMQPGSSPETASLVAYVTATKDYLLANDNTHVLPNGDFFKHNNKYEVDWLYDEIFARGGYDKHGIEFPVDACVVDVGANAGMFVLFVADRCPKGRIYAVEPMTASFAYLLWNIRQCQAAVTPMNVGLGAQVGKREFAYYDRMTVMARLNEYDHDDVVGGRLKQQLHNQELLGHAGARELLREIDGLIGERSTKRRERANVITLSDLIQSESIERIDLLKIDVEGAELEVLDGIADDHWNCIDQIVLEVENDSPDRLTLESVRNTLEARGYHVVVDVDPFLAGTELYNVYGWRDSRRQRRAGFDPGRRRATVVFPEMLRERVGACLPSYMVPAAIIPLDAFPLTPNGKIDRRALPLYAPKLRSEGLRTWSMPTEVALRQLFADALGVSDIGLHEDFFAMGGHSLLAVQVVNRARSSLGVELTIGALFEYPTVAQLAASIASQQKALDPLHHILPLRRQGTGAPLFCLPPAGGLGWRYAGLLSVIDDRPLYCLQVKGIGDETSFPGTVSAFAADYVKDIRQIQAEGPYHLLGSGSRTRRRDDCRQEAEAVCEPDEQSTRRNQSKKRREND